VRGGWPRPICAGCGLRGDCLCAAAPRIDNQVEIVIVRHRGEADRASNSGRLAALALARCRIVEHGGPGGPLADGAFDRDGAWLLFPEPGPPASTAPPRRLVVLDATWSQARKMRQRLPAVRGLPALAIAAPPGPFPALRAPPRPGQLPTVLAIAEALAALEGEAVAAPLRALWREVVARIARDRRRPTVPTAR
jgi:DTW domain-containing protein YfiP